jgi:hypothetical protein
MSPKVVYADATCGGIGSVQRFRFPALLILGGLPSTTVLCICKHVGAVE